MFSKLYYFRNSLLLLKHRSFASKNENLHPGNKMLANQRALFAPIRKLRFVPRFSPQCPLDTFIHRRTRQGGSGGGGGTAPPTFGKPWKFGQMLGKIKKIRADLSKNRLNSENFIAIL